MRLFTFVFAVFFILSSGACGEDLNPAPAGEACDSADSCEGDACIQELGTDGSADPITFQDGYCSVAGCVIDEMDATDDCAEGSTCLYYDYNWFDDVPYESFCFVRGCDSDLDCREGFSCVDFGTPFVSDPVCIPTDAIDGDASKVSGTDYSIKFRTTQQEVSQ